MKQKIKIIDKTVGKTLEGEVVLRDEDHFQTQLKTRSNVFKPKKGKGSFSRKQKHKHTFIE